MSRKKIATWPVTLVWSWRKTFKPGFPSLKAHLTKGKRVCNAYTCYRHNHVMGAHFPCPKVVPITSLHRSCTERFVYSTTSLMQYHREGENVQITNCLMIRILFEEINGSEYKLENVCKYKSLSRLNSPHVHVNQLEVFATFPIGINHKSNFHVSRGKW